MSRAAPPFGGRLGRENPFSNGWKFHRADQLQQQPFLRGTVSGLADEARLAAKETDVGGFAHDVAVHCFEEVGPPRACR